MIADNSNRPEHVAELRARLREAEETLEAIRTGAVDAVIVGGPGEAQVYTLESADRPYRLLIEQMQEGALTLNATGRILYCNRRFAELVGSAPGTLLGVPLAHYAAPADHMLLAGLIHEALTEEARGEFALIGADGVARPVHISLAHLPGETVILCGIVSDLTEENRRSKQLADTNRELLEQMSDRERAEAQLRQAQKMEAVGQLTGGVAHDFNNLLTIIIGNLQLALPKITDPAVKRKLAHAITAAEKGARLNEQLLSFARRQTLRMDAVDVRAILPSLKDLILHAVGPNVTLNVSSEPDLWSCSTDRNQLDSALLNLAINARDAMAEGGVLTIAAANIELRAGDPLTGADLAPGKYVVITVTDTGTGIDPAHLPRVVEPFFTTKGVGAGSGLGLSQVYGFVRQSGGTLKIDSTLGRGTAIRLYLPQAETAGLEIPAVAAVPGDAPHETVLIVEDDDGVRALAVEMLAELGYRVRTASRADEALAVLERETDIDLVFSDVVMPGSMNGVELAKRIRQSNPRCGVLLTSGYTAGAGARPGGAADFDFLPKPYQIDALNDAIAGALNHRT